MALKTGDKSDEPDPIHIQSIPANCKTESKNSKPARRKYSAKKAELQVRKRNIGIDIPKGPTNCCFSQSVSSATMFYPPCPYYPVTFNEWIPAIQPPMYSLQPLPVIVNPVPSTQICPYSPIVVSPATVASEFPLSPLVRMTNEFPLLTNDVSPLGTSSKCSMYCEPVNNLPHIYSNLAICNELLLETPVLDNSQFPLQLSNHSSACGDYEVTTRLTSISNDYLPLVTFGYEFSPIETTISDIFSPIQNMQMPQELLPVYSNRISPLSSCSYESNEYELPIVDEAVGEVQDYKHCGGNALEFYLSLPKDLFPTATMMTIDPNSIIDEFCRVSNLEDNSWILDLEFGVPKTPVTRRVATYNVKMNSIYCKNTPEAIHPGFEGCDENLKRVLTFYYDCVISNWYRGYMAISSDRSVENFQSWLILPMQALGMCWP